MPYEITDQVRAIQDRQRRDPYFAAMLKIYVDAYIIGRAAGRSELGQAHYVPLDDTLADTQMTHGELVEQAIHHLAHKEWVDAGLFEALATFMGPREEVEISITPPPVWVPSEDASVDG